MNEAVLKVGGSSLSDAQNISNVARIIASYYLNNPDVDLSVVASAFGAEPGRGKDYGVTNTLLRAADHAYNGNLEGALSEIENVKIIHYKIVDDLKFDRSLVEPNLTTLEEKVRTAVREREQGTQLNKEKLRDALAGDGELMSTPILAAEVQGLLDSVFTRYEALSLVEKVPRRRLSNEEVNILLLMDMMSVAALGPKTTAAILDPESESSQKIYERLKKGKGQYAVFLDPREQGFVTDSNFENAALLDNSLDTEIARHHLSARAKNPNRILFYSGYVARDEHGSQTTLGRDGSNVTTIALAAAIKAKEVIIYSDRDGVEIVDSRIIGQSQTSRYLSYWEAVLLARWGGMKALQESSLSILNKKRVNIPINVRNSFNPEDPGTLITHKAIETRSNMKGIGIIPNLSYREFPVKDTGQFAGIEKILREYEGIEILWADLAGIGTNRKAKFILKKDPKKEKGNTDYFKRDLYEVVKREVYNKETAQGGFHHHDTTLITIVGEGLDKSHAEISKIESILAGLYRETKDPKVKAYAHHFPMWTNPGTIHVAVRNQDADDVVKAVYNQLKRINIVLYGLGDVGREFLAKAKERYEELGLNVVAVADTSGIYAKPGGFSSDELETIVAMKKRGIRAAGMQDVKDAVNFDDGKENNLQKIFEMAKGDFVLVDATDPKSRMLDKILYALEHGSKVISVNKAPYALRPLPSSASHQTLEQLANGKVRRLFKAMLRGQLYNRGTVGADIGIPGALLRILAQNPNYVTGMGAMSGTLGHTCTELDNGKTLSEAIESAIAKRITETTPYTDYSGLDVLNKLTILWRTIATKYGLGFHDCNINYESFIAPAVRKYKKKTGMEFDTSELGTLSKKDFAERMKLLDESFAELRAGIGNEYMFRYIGEISYDPSAKKYSLDVHLKAVHKDSLLGSLEGTENMFLFGADGPPKKPYGTEQGPGAGISQTADAIMHDLENIHGIVRGVSQAFRVSYRNYHPQMKDNKEGINWFPPAGPSARAMAFLRR